MNSQVPVRHSATDEPERLAVAFSRVLRGAGLDVPPDAPPLYARSMAAVGLGRPEAVYWAGRATLLRRPEDVPAYDAAFAAFWRGEPAVDLTVPGPAAPLLAVDDPGQGPDDGAPDAELMASPTLELRYSPEEVLHRKDFSRCTPGELAEVHRLMAAVRLGGAARRTRRRRPARRGDRPDLRRTVHDALRTGGEPVRRRWQAPVEQPRRVVLLCDISGSMAPYARPLLQFLHVGVAGRRRVEAFTLGTRLTRVTRVLSSRDPDAALADATAAVADWSGGTRLGDALAEFNDRWGCRGTARGAVVVILSDGWDRGDPAVVGAEMARLSRVASRVVWANPLKATPGYAPLVRGMAAALPYVDDFVEGHSLASLEALTHLIAGESGPGRRARLRP